MDKKVCVFTIHPAKDLRVLNRQCRSLQRNGWKVTLIAIANKRLDANAIIGPYEDAGIKVIGVEKWNTFWGRVKTLFRITNLALKEDADIYHFHDPDLLLPALFLKIRVRKPFIYDTHEHFNILFSYSVPDLFPLRQIVGGVVSLSETLLGSLFRNISVVYKEHIARFERLGCRVVFTPNYASIVDFVPTPVSEEEWEQRRKKVLFIGSLGPRRGSLLLPEIAKKVKEKCPDVEFLVTRRFHNQEQEKAMLEKLNSMGDDRIITFIPNVGGKDLPAVVRKAGIALSVDQPTRIGLTSQPTKTFEYMSQAVPIVASDLPHAREHIRDVGCGIVVKPDDPRQFAEAIIRLIENPDLAREMGEKGQKAFIEKYNWGIVEKRLLDFYDTIADHRKR